MNSPLSLETLSALAEDLIPVIRQAGALIMEIYKTEFNVEVKRDESPVTIADEQAEALILPALAALTPDIPIVAEEAVAAGRIPEVEGQFWLVDPLDGTKEFISKNGEFTVNIALIDQGQPVVGLVYAPALEQLYVGIAGGEAYTVNNTGRQPIHVRTSPPEGLTVVASRSHGDASALDAFLADYKVHQIKSAGSSLKLCLVATGEADMYPRLGRTMEWDIAAGHAVLAAAGGKLTLVNGDNFEYGKPDFANPHFVAWA